MKSVAKFFLFFLSTGIGFVSADVTEEAFTRIYQDKLWGVDEQGQGTSGSGSTIASTEKYREMLKNFLEKNHIRSVVDVGCGDWRWLSPEFWEGITYTGYDIVESVILKNQEKFSSPTITFIHANGIDLDLPEADLLLCKDVLQHLPNEDILKLSKQFKKFKYCLLTNDVCWIGKNSEQINGTLNKQISPGSGRMLDLTLPPFSFKGRKVLRYQEPGAQNVKEVLLIKR